MIDLAIRPLRTTDEAQQCALMMALDEPWKTLQRDYTLLLGTVSDPTKEVFVAYANDKLCGCVIIEMHGAFVGYVKSICVGPDWRGMGIGTALIQSAEQRIFRETPNVFLCVSSFNVRARQFYERLGYVVIGELHDYVVAGHAEVLLRKTIGPLVAITPHPPLLVP
jgi:ribosomal protein S18 acetylase RimI-like enzyme